MQNESAIRQQNNGGQTNLDRDNQKNIHKDQVQYLCRTSANRKPINNAAPLNKYQLCKMRYFQSLSIK